MKCSGACISTRAEALFTVTYVTGVTPRSFKVSAEEAPSRTVMAFAPLDSSNTTSPRTVTSPSTSSFVAGAAVALNREMSPTPTLPVGPSTQTRPTSEKSGRVVEGSALTAVVTPELAWARAGATAHAERSVKTRESASVLRAFDARGGANRARGIARGIPGGGAEKDRALRTRAIAASVERAKQSEGCCFVEDERRGFGIADARRAWAHARVGAAAVSVGSPRAGKTRVFRARDTSPHRPGARAVCLYGFSNARC